MDLAERKQHLKAARSLPNVNQRRRRFSEVALPLNRRESRALSPASLPKSQVQPGDTKAKKDKAAPLDALLREAMLAQGSGKRVHKRQVQVPRSLRDARALEGGEGQASESGVGRMHAHSLAVGGNKPTGPSIADRLLFARVRELVSKKKRRYKGENFNLDLSYITNRIVAMGFPSEEREGFYRNPIEEVVRFFESRHPHHYRVYNLCCEPDRKYSHDKFRTGQVVEMGFADHNAPPFSLLLQFCADAKAWLEKHPANVVATHCKAGKGRTGTVICCLFLFLNEFDTAQEALDYFGFVRTVDGKGVTIPSQIRYVRYFEQRDQHDHEHPPRLVLESVTLSSVPRVTPFGCDPYVLVTNNETALDSRLQGKTQLGMGQPKSQVVSFLEGYNAVLQGDCRFSVKHHSSIKDDENMFHFWIHTAFVNGQSVVLCKSELDGAARKDKLNLVYDSKFTVTVKFRDSAEQQDL